MTQTPSSPPSPEPVVFNFELTELAVGTLSGSPSELDALRLRLIGYKMKIDQQLSGLKLQLTAAIRRAAAQHRYSDYKWFQTSQEMVAKLGHESQRIQLLMGEVNRRIRQHNGATRAYPDAFVELARALLPPDDFKRISEAAHRVSSRSSSTSVPCELTATG